MIGLTEVLGFSAMLWKEWDFVSLTSSSRETHEDSDDGEGQRKENSLPGHERSGR